ncbi:MAG: hypothetical protein ACO1RT_21200 [Planctomycetaceae bacterium]
MSSARRRLGRLPAWWGSMVLVWLLGCQSGEQRPELHPVQGSLSVNGQPAEGALLSFHPADGRNFDARGSRPWATVEGDGSFTVSTYAHHDGAPGGEYRISVVWLDNPSSSDPVDRLAGRYASPAQSQWRVHIVPGENRLAAYEINGTPTLQPAGASGRNPSSDPVDEIP